jgi:signal transduction histidine kinase
MEDRWGLRRLQAKMTASYVAVTAGAVLLAEIAIIITASLTAAHPLSATELAARARTTAAGLAAKLSVTIRKARHVPPGSLTTDGTPVTPGAARPDGDGGIAIPQTTSPVCVLQPASVALVVDESGTVLASSYSACFAVGTQGSAPDAGTIDKVITSSAGAAGGGGMTTLPSGRVIWAAAPIVLAAAPSKPPAPSSGASPGRRYGAVYVEIPPVGNSSGGLTAAPALIETGVGVLALSVPVGMAFGLLSTRRLTRRLRRLAASTLEVAEGQFGQPIPVSGTDELAQLEDNFNRMAGRLSASLDAERRLAAANARHHERSRIARELHDSISQELFSLSVLSGGLRRSLPPGSPVLPAVETMERTAGDTMREMQALLLELRPVALGEAGLATALDGICRAHRERLGANVVTELEHLVLPTPVEHAILRIAQEALANAVKHADGGAGVVRLRLRSDQEKVTLEVADDGAGFDPRHPPGSGLGLRAMQERVDELGGDLEIDSAPGSSTVIRASFPWRPA